MIKFSNVDVIASLQIIMKQNTAFYQTDFDYDKKAIRRAAKSEKDKTLLWLSRPSGTYCFPEYRVFLKDEPAHLVWRYYHENMAEERVLAYVVELTECNDGKIMGNLYELNYDEHCEHVKKQACETGFFTMIYEKGEKKISATQHFCSYPDPELGQLVARRVHPNDPKEFERLLRTERQSRIKAVESDFDAHIRMLHNELFKAERKRILEEKKRLKEPNSPDKQSFVVEISLNFWRLVSEKELDKLVRSLPFEKITVADLNDKGRKYILIDAN